MPRRIGRRSRAWPRSSKRPSALEDAVEAGGLGVRREALQTTTALVLWPHGALAVGALRGGAGGRTKRSTRRARLVARDLHPRPSEAADVENGEPADLWGRGAEVARLHRLLSSKRASRRRSTTRAAARRAAFGGGLCAEARSGARGRSRPRATRLLKDTAPSARARRALRAHRRARRAERHHGPKVVASRLSARHRRAAVAFARRTRRTRESKAFRRSYRGEAGARAAPVDGEGGRRACARGRDVAPALLGPTNLPRSILRI